jgi:hypothetical protein
MKMGKAFFIPYRHSRVGGKRNAKNLFIALGYQIELGMTNYENLLVNREVFLYFPLTHIILKL